MTPPDRAIGLGSTSSTDRHAAVCLRRMILIELTARVILSLWRHSTPIDQPDGTGSAANSGESERHLIGAASFFSPTYALLIVARAAGGIPCRCRMQIGAGTTHSERASQTAFPERCALTTRSGSGGAECSLPDMPCP